MMNFLVAGVNMRDVACSIKRAGHSTFSVNFFNPVDLGNCAKEVRALLGEGRITTDYISDESETWKTFLVDNALDILESQSIDYIVPRINSELIGPLKKYAPILGTNLEELQVLRDKWQCTRAASKHGLNIPKTKLIDDSLKPANLDFPLVHKPVRGSRGLGVHRINNREQLEEVVSEKGTEGSHILQKYISGQSFNITFLSDGNGVVPIFVSRQLFEDSEGFVYSGNVGPISVDGMDDFIEKCSRFLSGFNVRGTLGVDFMVDCYGEIYFIEVNPRIQGSFEVIEASLGINMFEYYFKAWSSALPEVPPPQRYAGKKIITAVRDCRAPNLGGLEFIRDIPPRGVFIGAGNPICTVVATGRSESEVEAKLKNRLAEVLNSMI
jgi:predicted ATP-grasp superfamily ATP-dependent carboligase